MQLIGLIRLAISKRHILRNFKRAIFESEDCAIAVMSADDEFKDGSFRARQNVLFEIGYCSPVKTVAQDYHAKLKFNFNAGATNWQK